MREFVILVSSSSAVTPQLSSSAPYHHPSPKPKPKPSLQTPLSPSKPVPAFHSRTPLRWDLPTRQTRSLLKYYADLAAKLAEEGRIQEFSMVAESIVASGVEAKHFGALLSVKSVANGILQCLREGSVQGVIDVLRKMEKFGVAPVNLFDGVAMESLKEECRRIVSSGEVEEVVDLMETLAGFNFSIKELVEPQDMVKICVDKRKPKLAMRYASLLPRERILLCTIINEFGKKRDLDSALTAYEACKHNLRSPNMYVYRNIIDACGLCGDYRKSRYIYEDLLNQKITPNVYVFNSLMNVNAHDLGYTMLVYKNMQNLGVTADMASYNVLLKACCVAGRVDLAQEIYRDVKELESRGILKLDAFTYCTIIKVFADAKLWQMALKIKEDMLSSGVTLNMFTWSSLISACASAGLVEQAIQLFEEMLSAGCEPNSRCCNILLHACVEARQYDRAFRLFQSWKRNAIQETFYVDYDDDKKNILSEQQTDRRSHTSVPNLVSNSHLLNFIKKIPFVPSSTTYNILMKACGSDYHRAKALMDEMKTMGLSPNHISWSILIDICGGSGNVEGAIQVLKNMRVAGIQPDVIAYTTAIKICVETKNLKLAFSLFAEMKRYQIKPNSVTYDTLLRARTRYGSLKEVQQCLAVYLDMRKAGYKSNDYYLKQLIEEWCEGILQHDNQNEDEFAFYKRTDSGRPHSLLLEKVAAHLQNSIAESLAINIQDLTKVEARILVLAVLRMIKENYTSGHSVKDDMWISLGVNQVDVHQTKRESEVKDAVLELLQNKLGLEVLVVIPRFSDELEENLGRGRNTVSSPRRPVVLQRLKVTRKSLNHWLQRRVGASRR